MTIASIRNDNAQNNPDQQRDPSTMRNFFEGCTKEQTVQEAEEKEPGYCQDPWLVFHIRDL